MAARAAGAVAGATGAAAVSAAGAVVVSLGYKALTKHRPQPTCLGLALGGPRASVIMKSWVFMILF